MAPPENDPPTDPRDGVDASLDDLGRRIVEAQAAEAARNGHGRRRAIAAGAALIGAGVAGLSVVLIASGDGSDDDAAVRATTTSEPAEAATTTSLVTTTSEPAEAATTTTAVSATAAPSPTTAPPTTAPAPATVPPAAPAPAAPAEVPVGTGDSFWSIAERVLSQRLGRPATDAEVTPFWIRFVTANLDRLVRPGDPDLILPGQVLVLPPAGD